MTISIRRFLVASISLIFIFGTVTGLMFWYSSHSSKRATDLLVDAVESLALTQDLQMNLAVHRRQSLLRDFRTDEQRKLAVQESDFQILNDLDKIPNFSSTKEEDQIVLQVQKHIQKYLQTYHFLRQQGIFGNELFLKLNDQYNQSQESLQNLIDTNLQQTKAIEAEAQAQNGLWSALMASALFVLFILVALFTYGSRQLLYRPILRLKKSIDDFELGSPLAPAPVSGASEIQDISQSFQKLREKLSHQKELQLISLSSIAHDLKNPLGAIKMSAEILSESQALADGDKQVLAIISRQSDHMKRLVNDLLDTTRIESGHLEFNMASLDIRQILQDCVLLHSNLSPLHELKFQMPTQPIFVWADAQRITQVFNNLLSNAIKYSPMGGVVKVQVRTEEDLVSVAITDPGVGISQADLKGIFEPFRRATGTQRSIPGVGLGLAVSKKIIAAHPGGSILVDSELGKGSTFTIQLALHQPQSFEGKISFQENSEKLHNSAGLSF